MRSPAGAWKPLRLSMIWASVMFCSMMIWSKQWVPSVYLRRGFPASASSDSDAATEVGVATPFPFPFALLAKPAPPDPRPAYFASAMALLLLDPV